MRYRVSVLLFLASVAVVPLYAQGQSPSPSVGKIGLINNIQEAIFATAEGKKALAELQKKFQPRQQDLQRQQQEIQALQEQLQKQATTLSDEERVRLTRDLEDKQKVFKRSQEDATQDFQVDRDDALRRIGQKMMRVLNEYAQQNGFVLVVDAAQIPVYFAARELDLTEEIVKRFDAANPVADAAATTSAPGSTAPAPTPALKPVTPAPIPSKPAADKPK